MNLVEGLERRAGIVRGIRAFFDGLGFVEVETAVRIPAPAPEPHIDCPELPAPAPDPVRTGRTFLRASPELQMKKLLASGMKRIYQLGPCFREGESGSRHRPEFTMLEWYRAGADYMAILDDMERLVGPLLHFSAPFPRLSVRDAYLRFAGWDPFADFDQDRFDFDMAAKVEPSLPGGPVFLLDYPPAAASLSKLRGEGSGAVAERWELYVDRIELANAFTELADPVEQRRRFESARAERVRLGEADYPLDEEFLEMLAVMPPAGGVALGVDRLVMLALGAGSIAEVRAPV